MGRRTIAVVAAVLAVCLLLAGAASFVAASTPDRPDEVADRQRAGASPTEQDARDGLAGIVGVGGALVVVAGLAMVVRPRFDSRRR